MSVLACPRGLDVSAARFRSGRDRPGWASTGRAFSNAGAAGHYVQHSFALAPSSYNGRPGRVIVLKFTATGTVSGKTTSFLIDDTALKAS